MEIRYPARDETSEPIHVEALRAENPRTATKRRNRVIVSLETLAVLLAEHHHAERFIASWGASEV